ncbi:BACON domain-containing protein [Weeksellaceae bacterium TAE3-ERU29]|nr:BACON domain-containing protein [Weeksellaceae bacterium TAE3-ERU29]
MKKQLFFVISFLFAISLFSSCSDDSVSKPYLKISKTDLSFSPSASNETINIETNQEAVKILASESWIKTEKSGNDLKISVEENTIAKERNGVIKIDAGNLHGEIKVKQDAAGVNITISPETINTESDGGTYNIQVSTNSPDYSAKTENNWIKIETNSEENTIKLTIDKNENKELRVGKVSFYVDGKIIKEIPITQQGVTSFVLPYLTFGATAIAVKGFEESRSNPILRETDIGGTGTQVAFKVTDEIFDEIVYLINLKGYAQSSLFVKGGTLNAENLTAFENFLLNEGFEKRTEKGYETTISFEKKDKTVFINSEKQVKIEFMSDRNHNHYRVIYFPVQTSDYTTFTELPYFEKGITKEQVMNYEAAHNGTLNDDKSKMNYGDENAKKDKLFFDVAGEEVMGRTYYVYFEGQQKHGLTQITNYYADVHLAYYQGLDGDYYLTKEFLELAKNNGFIYYDNIGGSSVFKNEEKNIKMFVKWYKDSDLNWTLRIIIY